MVKRTAALALALICFFALTSCGISAHALPEERHETQTPLPAATGGGDAKAGIIERMAGLTENDVKSISSTFSHVSARELARAISGAAEHRIDGSEDYFEDRLPFYDLTAYLSGGPEAYGSDDEQFILWAGLQEDIVEIHYRNGKGDSERRFFSDRALYRLIRDNYRTDDKIDPEAYDRYRNIIEARAQKTVDDSVNRVGSAVFTGYEIVFFTHIDTFETADGVYKVYDWSPAFTADDPEGIGWVGGMYLDAQGRVRGCELETCFAVKTAPAGAQEEYRFLFGDLYLGPNEAAGRENAWETIARAFAEPA